MVQGRTDHGADITQMRLCANQIRVVLASSDVFATKIQDLVREATILDAAAALLECHDDTGISLDDWPGPRALVELAFEIISPFGAAKIQPNQA